MPTNTNFSEFEVKPGTQKDYAVAWEDWLASGELISSVVWTVPTGVTVQGTPEVNSSPVVLDIKDADGVITQRTFPANTVAIAYLLMADTVSQGEVYDVECEMTSDAAPVPRIEKQTVRLKVVSRYRQT